MSDFECKKGYLVQGNDSFRKKGYSGALINIFMHAIIKQGGIVCAPAWNEKNGFQYVCFETEANINQIKFPFLVMGEEKNIICEMKKHVNKTILFIGLPCQIERIKQNTSGLDIIFVELICQGATSNFFFHKYFDMFKKYGIFDFSFYEDRRYYYYNLCMNHLFKDGTYFRQEKNKNNFFASIESGIALADDCLQCEVNLGSNLADIVIGDVLDFSQWEAVGEGKALQDKLGTNYIAINTDKGRELFIHCIEEINNIYELSESEKELLEICYKIPKNIEKEIRNRFTSLLNLDTYDFDKAYHYAKNQKFDVGINGDWTDYNYGAVLTAVALAWCVQDLGYSAMLVQHGIRPLYNPKMLFSVMGEKIWSSIYISDCYLNVTACEELNDKIDVYLLGSDVNWKSQYMFSGSYLGEYVRPGIPRIAYSTSFGDDRYYGASFLKKKASGLMKGFNGVSVREDVGVDICKEFQIEASHVLDPVFICDFQKYRELVKGVNMKLPQKYLLYYGVHSDPLGERKRCVEYIAEKLNLEIVTILGINSCIKSGEKYYTADEFLNCFMHASFFVGDSFHGMCFSIINHVPFVTFALPYNAKERIYSLARDFKLEKRVYSGFDMQQLKMQRINEEIDWNWVDRRLEERKEYSLKWLKNQIQNACCAEETVNGDWINRLQKRIVELNTKIVKQEINIVKMHLKEKVPKNSKVAIRGAGVETKQLLPLLEKFFEESNIILKAIIDADISNNVQYKNQLIFAIADTNIDVYKDIDKVIIITSRHHDVIKEQLIKRGLDNEKIVDLSEFLIANDICSYY